jgi:hypothetical protein
LSFETGAGWLSRKPLVLLCAGGLRKADVPWPIGGLQVVSLDEDETVAHAFSTLGSRAPTDLDAFLQQARVLAEQGVRDAAAEQGWEGVYIGARFFGWAGPTLDALHDGEPETEPHGLIEAIRKAGVEPAWAQVTRVGESTKRGALMVYSTDRKRLRRRIVNGDTVLVVRPPGTEKPPGPRIFSIST